MESSEELVKNRAQDNEELLSSLREDKHSSEIMRLCQQDHEVGASPCEADGAATPLFVAGREDVTPSASMGT